MLIISSLLMQNVYAVNNERSFFEFPTTGNLNTLLGSSIITNATIILHGAPGDVYTINSNLTLSGCEVIIDPGVKIVVDNAASEKQARHYNKEICKAIMDVEPSSA